MWRLFTDIETGTFHAFNEPIEEVDQLPDYQLTDPAETATHDGVFDDPVTEREWFEGKYDGPHKPLPVIVHGDMNDEVLKYLIWTYDEEEECYKLTPREGQPDRGSSDHRDYLDRVETGIVERLDEHEERTFEKIDANGDRVVERMEALFGGVHDQLAQFHMMSLAHVASSTDSSSIGKRATHGYVPSNPLVATFWGQVTDVQLLEFRSLLRSKGFFPGQELFKPEDAAKILGWNEQTIRRWCREGHIEAHKQTTTRDDDRERWDIHLSAIMYAKIHGKLPARSGAK